MSTVGRALVEQHAHAHARRCVRHELALLRQTYGLLQDEASADRAQVLEVTIIVLIALEIVLALLKF